MIHIPPHMSDRTLHHRIDSGTISALLTTMASASDKVTIYYKGPGGNILRQEAHFLRIIDRCPSGGADIVYRRPRGRREYVIQSYYSSFWMVVEDWNQPMPDSLFVNPVIKPGVTVSTGRYRSTDPAWVTDFLAGAGRDLKVRAVFHNKTLQVNAPVTAPGT